MEIRVLCHLVLPLALVSAVSDVAAAGGDLFWYDTAGQRVQRCDVDSCTPADFATSLSSALDGDIAIDPVEGMVYWGISAAANSKVQRKSLSGGAVADIFDLGGPMTGIAIDPVARQVYVGTPSIATRIWRYSIDAPGSPTSFVHALDTGCSSCSPQGLALAGGFLYWADLNNGKIARKPLDSSTGVQDVVTGISQPRSLALDVANDRVYFSQTLPNRMSYALLSSPTTIVDLPPSLPDGLFPGGLELDRAAGTLGELYVAHSGSQEIRHCDLDAGCSTLVLLTSGMMNNRGLALLPAGSAVPGLGADGAAWLAATLLLAGIVWLRRSLARPRVRL